MNDKTVVDVILDTVLNQINTGDPPEAKLTYDRLIEGGASNAHAMQLMAVALRAEMGRMLSDSTPFDNERYAALLADIPTRDD